MKLLLIVSFMLLSLLAYSQKSPLRIFDQLVGKTWKAEGAWGDGSKFFQEITMEYALDSSAILLNAIGFIDKNQTELGHRNHGVRQYDAGSNTIRFWEFDVFGGLTEGVVNSQGKNIFYQYEYGDAKVTDMWEYVNDSTYNFKVGKYQNGMWHQVYLSTQFVAVKTD